MTFSFKNLQRAVLSAFMVFLCHCGAKSKSQGVLIAVNPPRPIVFASDIPTTIGGQLTTITGPAFGLGISLNNTTDTPVTIAGLQLDVTGTDATGNQVTTTTTFSAAQYSYAVTTAGSTVQCVYNDFGVFTPGADPFDPQAPATCPTSGTWKNSITQNSNSCTAGGLISQTVNNSAVYLTPSTLGCTAIYNPQFYVGSNPSGPDGTTFTYRVKVSPLGWFGDRTHPSSRFQNSVYSYTQ